MARKVKRPALVSREWFALLSPASAHSNPSHQEVGICFHVKNGYCLVAGGI